MHTFYLVFVKHSLSWTLIHYFELFTERFGVNSNGAKIGEADESEGGSFKMKNPNKSKNLSSQLSYLEMWLYNKRPCRAAAGARALFAPVDLCESIRKFVQRLPINCPPDLPPRFVQDERKLTSAHQTHLGAWRDRRMLLSVQDEGKVFPAAGVDVHVKQFTPLVDLHDVIEREYPNMVVLNCDSRKAARGAGNERHASTSSSLCSFFPTWWLTWLKVILVYPLDSFLLNICGLLSDPCRTHVPERVFISRCFFAAQVNKFSNSV